MDVFIFCGAVQQVLLGMEHEDQIAEMHTVHSIKGNLDFHPVRLRFCLRHFFQSWRFILLCQFLRYFIFRPFFRFWLRKDTCFLQESRDGGFCLFIIAFDIATAKDAEALPFVGKGRGPGIMKLFVMVEGNQASGQFLAVVQVRLDCHGLCTSLFC